MFLPCEQRHAFFNGTKRITSFSQFLWPEARVESSEMPQDSPQASIPAAVMTATVDPVSKGASLIQKIAELLYRAYAVLRA